MDTVLLTGLVAIFAAAVPQLIQLFRAKSDHRHELQRDKAQHSHEFMRDRYQRGYEQKLADLERHRAACAQLIVQMNTLMHVSLQANALRARIDENTTRLSSLSGAVREASEVHDMERLGNLLAEVDELTGQSGEVNKPHTVLEALAEIESSNDRLIAQMNVAITVLTLDFGVVVVGAGNIGASDLLDPFVEFVRCVQKSPSGDKVIRARAKCLAIMTSYLALEKRKLHDLPGERARVLKEISRNPNMLKMLAKSRG